MPDSVYWIWHQLMFGFTTARSHKLLEEFSHPRELYESGDGLTAPERDRTRAAMEKARRVRAVTLKKGCHIVTPDHPDYPPWLSSIYAKPAALYVKGDLGCLRDRLAIAMVGTRGVSDYGRQATEMLAGDLSRRGAVIVSGLAVGVDSIAHATAIHSGSRTIGVMGCGLDINYPLESRSLKRAMVDDGGAVLSEYPMGTGPKPLYFPQRNRIIAGVSHGVVVVEAGHRSGALITAKLALDMGRDVFAVPGNIFSEKHRGVHLLLKQGLAKPIDSADDILEEYPEFAPKDPAAYIAANSGANRNTSTRGPAKQKPDAKPTGEKAEQPLPDPPDELRETCAALGASPRTADQIAAALEKEIGPVLSDLTMLEILGIAESRPGGYFVRARS